MKFKIAILFCLVVKHFYSQTNACFFSESIYSCSFPGETTKFSQNGDINNDGKQDIITVSYNNETMSILPGSGNGLFNVFNNYYVGRAFQGPDDAKILINDIDSDGLNDILMSGEQTTYSGVIIAMNKNANIILSPNTPTFCINASVNLIANQAATYLWQPGGQTTVSISVNGTGISINLNGCTSISTKSVTTVICTKLKDSNSENSTINIFPNPSDKNLNIISSTNILKITVFNTIGQTTLVKENSNET